MTAVTVDASPASGPSLAWSGPGADYLTSRRGPVLGYGPAWPDCAVLAALVLAVPAASWTVTALSPRWF